jgi:hypothetical protein
MSTDQYLLHLFIASVLFQPEASLDRPTLCPKRQNGLHEFSQAAVNL